MRRILDVRTILFSVALCAGMALCAHAETAAEGGDERANHIRDVLEVFAFLPLFLLTVTVHEYSHGYVAYRLGDTTAKERGRLTLNPIAHMSLVLTLLLPALVWIATWFRFTIALLKPVPINPLRFRDPKRGLLLVGLAGPLSNFAIAFLLSLLTMSGIIPVWGFWGSVRTVLGLLIIVNILLGTFNILPIPPLDGSRVLVGLLPRRYGTVLLKLDRYGIIFIIAFFASVAIMAGGLLEVVRVPLKSIWKFIGLDGVRFDDMFTTVHSP
jgi:Zn-dependent protease